MAFDAFLKIEGIDGESTDDKHQKWIEVLSVSHGLSQPATTTSAGGSTSGGRCDHQDVTIVKQADSSTPNLMLSCCSGKAHKSATIEFCRAMEDKQTFIKWELSNVVVTGVRPYAAGGADVPQEEISLNYAAIKWTYTMTDPSGRLGGDVVTGWDLEKNVKM